MHLYVQIKVNVFTFTLIYAILLHKEGVNLRKEHDIMSNVNVTIRMDEDMKRQADDLFSDLGMTLSGAVTVFIKQAIRQQAIPFIVGRDVPNKETMEAIEEVQRMKGDPMKKTYQSFDEILREIDNEV